MNVLNLETWFKKHQRDLPFRHTQDPYTIWVSEVMLQQTQMETVLPYFRRFMERFPTLQSLATSSLETVLTLVQGMGYYRRFKLLHQGALYILEQHQGKFPTTYEDVSKIPGVGEYTAGAIMSIAYNQPYAATDGNVLRVLSRLYGIEENIALPKEKKQIHILHQQNVEKSTPRIYTQAVMELGALICRPSQPKCKQCPLQQECYAYLNQKTDLLPKIERKQTMEERFFQTFWLVRDGKLAFVQSQGPLLEGMYLLPQIEKNTFSHSPKELFFRHQFSHQRWHMHLFEVNEIQPQKLQWIPLDKLDTIPIPQAHKKIVKHMLLNQKSV